MRATSELQRAIALGVAGAAVFVGLTVAVRTPEEIRVAPFNRYAEAMREGEIPYRDFTVEYPPGSIPVIVAPLLLPAGYAHSFRAVQTVFGVLLVLAVAVLLRRARPSHRVAAVTLVAALPLLLGPVTTSRYDLFPTALVAWALVAVEATRARAAGALLGIAVAAKAYPVVLFPAFAAYVETRLARRVRQVVVPGAAAFAVLTLGCVFVAPGGVAYSTISQLGRGLQLESVGACVVLLASHLGLPPPDVVFASGSQTVVGAAATAASIATSLVGVLAIVAFAWMVWYHRNRLEGLRASSSASLALVLVTSKVFSPQFLVWIVPLAVVVELEAWAWIVGLLAVACVLTQAVYPGRYEELVAGDLDTVLVLVARNALVVAVTVILVRHVLKSLRLEPSVISAAPAG